MAGLYVHVPFCRAKCWYCDFYSLPRIAEFSDEYVRLLEREWNLRKHEVTGFRTIYFGGGTPSALSEVQLKKIAEWLPVSSDIKEFTIEANPEDVSEDLCRVWRSFGVDRVSMGVQSFNDNELGAVGRRHDSRRALEAYSLLSTHFDNISLDFMIGLPGQTVETLSASIRQAIGLRPEHLSVYILGYEQGTRLWAMRKAGKIVETDEETLSRMYTMVCRMLADAGYEHYEISNFCLQGRKSLHNSGYWDGTPYLGLGPGAHSFDGLRRRYNPGNIKEWMQKLNAEKSPAEIEDETPEEQVNDMLMVGLRTARGIDLNVFNDNVRNEILRNVSKLPVGRVVLEGTTIRIPEAAWIISDDTISRLFL